MQPIFERATLKVTNIFRIFDEFPQILRFNVKTTGFSERQQWVFFLDKPMLRTRAKVLTRPLVVKYANFELSGNPLTMNRFLTSSMRHPKRLASFSKSKSG